MVGFWRLTQWDVFDITSSEYDVLIDVVFGRGWPVCGSALWSKWLHCIWTRKQSWKVIDRPTQMFLLWNPLTSVHTNYPVKYNGRPKWPYWNFTFTSHCSHCLCLKYGLHHLFVMPHVITIPYFRSKQFLFDYNCCLRVDMLSLAARIIYLLSTPLSNSRYRWCIKCPHTDLELWKSSRFYCRYKESRRSWWLVN